jgi:hypothetical protein
MSSRREPVDATLTHVDVMTSLTSHDRGAELGFELVQHGGVDDAGYHRTHVHAHVVGGVVGHQTVHVLDRKRRFHHRGRGGRLHTPAWAGRYREHSITIDDDDDDSGSDNDNDNDQADDTVVNT